MAIGWNETVPSPSSAASSADDELRSFMTNVSGGLATGFLWPGTGGTSVASAGLSNLGNARLAIAGNSAVTGRHGDGFLLLNRNHMSLHHIGSTWTAMLGHASMVDHAPASGYSAAAQVNSHWVTQSGTTTIPTTDGFGTISVVFPVGYSETTPPFVMVSQKPNTISSLASTYGIQISSISTGGFSAVYSGNDATKPGTDVFWESSGTVLL